MLPTQLFGLPLPQVAVYAFVAGVLPYVASKMYGLGALAPESLSVRKSAQSRSVDITKWPARVGAGGALYLFATGLLPEVLPAIATATVTLGGLMWAGTELYGTGYVGRGRKTALTPIGRRCGALAAAAFLFLNGTGLAAVAPVAGLVGYTVYARSKSE